MPLWNFFLNGMVWTKGVHKAYFREQGLTSLARVENNGEFFSQGNVENLKIQTKKVGFFSHRCMVLSTEGMRTTELKKVNLVAECMTLRLGLISDDMKWSMCNWNSMTSSGARTVRTMGRVEDIRKTKNRLPLGTSWIRKALRGHHKVESSTRGG